MFFFFSGSGAAPDPRLLPLSAIVSGCVFDLDATLAASYDGTSQLWKNLVPAPADGAAQAAYDFTLGATASASTDDPTFNGTAGSPAAYFSTDGGDIFQLPANTQFMKDLHKTTGGTNWTVVSTNRTPASGIVAVLGNLASARFVNVQWTSSATRMQVAINGDSLGSNVNHTACPVSTDCFMAASWNGTHITVWGNTATGTAYAYTVPASSTDASTLYIALRNNAAFTPAGTRLYSLAMFNKALSNAEMALVKEQLELRHERTY